MLLIFPEITNRSHWNKWSVAIRFSLYLFVESRGFPHSCRFTFPSPRVCVSWAATQGSRPASACTRNTVHYTQVRQDASEGTLPHHTLFKFNVLLSGRLGHSGPSHLPRATMEEWVFLSNSKPSPRVMEVWVFPSTPKPSTKSHGEGWVIRRTPDHTKSHTWVFLSTPVPVMGLMV